MRHVDPATLPQPGAHVDVHVQDVARGQTGPVLVREYTEAGVTVGRDTWYGTADMTIAWQYVVMIQPLTEAQVESWNTAPRGDGTRMCPTCVTRHRES